MEVARTLPPPGGPVEAGPAGETSPLARARLHRRLTLEETARRAGIPADELRWLEEARLYRFPDPDRALLAAILVGSALGVDHREALELAGLPAPASPLGENPWRRLAAVGAAGAAVVALTLAVVLARTARTGGAPAAAATATTAPATTAAARPALPPPWTIKVVVLDGAGDIVRTRAVADRIEALSYRVVLVRKAGSSTYRRTQVYYPPGGEAVGRRLARRLGAPLEPLPGGDDPRRLVVIVGPPPRAGG